MSLYLLALVGYCHSHSKLMLSLWNVEWRVCLLLMLPLKCFLNLGHFFWIAAFTQILKRSIFGFSVLSVGGRVRSLILLFRMIFLAEKWLLKYFPNSGSLVGGDSEYCFDEVDVLDIYLSPLLPKR